MDGKTKAETEAGVPIVVVHWDENKNVTLQETYNLQNISLPDWQKRALGRAVYEVCRRFYSNPENVKKYEAWKAKRDEEAKKHR